MDFTKKASLFPGLAWHIYSSPPFTFTKCLDPGPGLQLTSQIPQGGIIFYRWVVPVYSGVKSNARLLSSEIATALRGRTISYELYPFSFREYLLHKRYNPEKQNTTTDKALLRGELQHYLEEGGYPETIGQSASTRAKILKAYLDVMIYRDLIERYNITNHNALKQYIKKMLANTAPEASIHKTYQ